MLYRIVTEDKRRKAIWEIIDKYYYGYTWWPAHGVWKGKHERSLVIEIDAGRSAYQHIRFLAQKIAAVNHQECVLTQRLKSDSRLIAAEGVHRLITLEA